MLGGATSAHGTCPGSGGFLVRHELHIGPIMKRLVILVMSLALPGWIAAAVANPWIDESGKSRYRSNYARHDGFYLHSGRKGHRDWASVPQGHWPPPGKCRAWFLSRLPGC